jgi:photosystem II stability/assembly factor-like uncharacterized protein
MAAAYNESGNVKGPTDDRAWPLHSMRAAFSVGEGRRPQLAKPQSAFGRHAGPPSLFDSRFGVAALSTAHGALFAITTNGGVTWKYQPSDLAYPDALLFLNLGGTATDTQVLTPRLFLTTDGGDSWCEASLPGNSHGSPHDLFFVDRQHGWLVLWNTGTTGAESALLESTDGGITWTVSRVGALLGAKRLVNAVRFLSEDVGFVLSEDSGTSASTGNAAVLWTTDRGQTWHSRALPAAVQFCEVAESEVWCSSGMDLVKIRATQ